MKTKLYKILGVALTLVLLASLTVGLAGAPAGAASSNLKWAKLEMPMVEEWDDTLAHDTGADDFANTEGDYWCAPGTDVGPIAMSPDGKTMFAAVAADGYFTYNTAIDWYEVLKSTDGGYSWTVTGFFEDGWDDYDGAGADDGTTVMDIVVSPDYNEDSTVAVATKRTVYQSVDGGDNFVCMDDDPDWWAAGERIRDLDVALDDRGRLAYMVGTYDWIGGGDVYVFSTETGLQWEPQLLGANADVMACAFVPPFEDTEGICAVVTDYNGNGEATPSTTTVRFSFGNTQDGGGWGNDIMDAPVTDAEGKNFSVRWASIGFPDDFDPWGIGNNLFFVGTYVSGWENDDPPFTDVKGDVYKIVCKESGNSSATDLDVRGVLTTLLPTETDIFSIDVCGPAEEASIIVGTDLCDLGLTPEQYLVYYSSDSGETWEAAAKPPTGGDPDGSTQYFDGAWTHVLMGPDFCDGGDAFASTLGDGTSAISYTTDGADSWNQIGIIDYGNPDGWGYWTNWIDATGYLAEGSLYMVTAEDYDYTMTGTPYVSALWQRVNGKHWERIFSYANPDVTNSLYAMTVLGETFFMVDYANDSIWRSSDMGATWPKKITPKEPLGSLWWSCVSIVDETTIYTGHAGGNVWWSTKSGVGWTSPDDSDIPTSASVTGIEVWDDVVIFGTDIGSVFVSSDGGETIARVGKTGGAGMVSTDLGFLDYNNTLYASDWDAPGVWRTEVDFDDPSDSEWERIDIYQDSTGDVVYDESTVGCACPLITLPFDGVGYIIDYAPVDTDPDNLAGGLWRCTNPTADVDSTSPPYFEKEVKGLTGDGLMGSDMIWLATLDLDPMTLAPTFFCVNDSALYYDAIVMFTDTLHSGVILTSPGSGETGVGLLPEGYVYPEVILAWEEMAGATSYQYQVALDANFKTKVEDNFTDSLATPDPLELQPNTTYYWHVRVANEGSLIGAPLISPWSATQKFKTAIGASMARPNLQAPWPGEPDVPLSPTFEWSGIEWAETYEYELAIDPTTSAGGYFAEPLVALTGTNALVSTAWKCDITLDYETRYYWHVKAIGVDTDTPWSDVGTFTTMGVPPEPVEPGGEIIIPPPNVITPAWIWAIVIIGAILVIAVIVLIVTTRRVP